MLAILTSTHHKPTRYSHKLVNTLQVYWLNIWGINLATAAANKEQGDVQQKRKGLEADCMLLVWKEAADLYQTG